MNLSNFFCVCCSAGVLLMITGFKMHNEKVFSLFALCQIDPALLLCCDDDGMAKMAFFSQSFSKKSLGSHQEAKHLGHQKCIIIQVFFCFQRAGLISGDVKRGAWKCCRFIAHLCARGYAVVVVAVVVLVADTTAWLLELHVTTAALQCRNY